MDFRELESLVQAYREPWEQTRSIVRALTGEPMPLPWDNEIKAANAAELKKEAEAAKAIQSKRIAAAQKLNTMQFQTTN